MSTHVKATTTKGQALYRRAKQLIPGGTQLASKRPELYLPDQWPSYYQKARGVEVTDIDGNTYVDMSMMAIGACVLGYADPDVDGAVKAAIDAGSASTLNSPEEVELAELLCELHPWARMVRFARSGGSVQAGPGRGGGAGGGEGQGFAFSLHPPRSAEGHRRCPPRRDRRHRHGADPQRAAAPRLPRGGARSRHRNRRGAHLRRG